MLVGYRNADITTHYSAPGLEELLEVANRVCEEMFDTDYAEIKTATVQD